MNYRDNSCRRIYLHRSRRGFALYVAVLSTTLIVSVLGLTALTVVRIERKEASAIKQRLTARSYARSAVELGLAAVSSDSTWRSQYQNNVETVVQPLGPTGTVSWVLSDVDGSLADADTLLRIRGVGRLGSVVQVSSVLFRPTEVGPQLLRSNTSSSNSSNDKLERDKWWGQYLKVTLPAEANGWKINSVEVLVKREKNNRLFSVRIRAPLPNKLPSSTIIDSSDVDSRDLNPDSLQWHRITFGGEYWLDTTDGVCITLETNESSEPLLISYRSGGVSEVNSGLLTGDPTWKPLEQDKSLRYRVYGTYTTPSGVHPVPGTWLWDAP